MDVFWDWPVWGMNSADALCPGGLGLWAIVLRYSSSICKGLLHLQKKILCGLGCVLPLRLYTCMCCNVGGIDCWFVSKLWKRVRARTRAFHVAALGKVCRHVMLWRTFAHKLAKSRAAHLWGLESWGLLLKPAGPLPGLPVHTTKGWAVWD